MQDSEIIERIRSAVPDATGIEVNGEDCSFSVVVVSPSFVGLPLLKRQQLVLGKFSDLLASGQLHALSVSALTPEELGKQSQNLTQLSI